MTKTKLSLMLVGIFVLLTGVISIILGTALTHTNQNQTNATDLSTLTIDLNGGVYQNNSSTITVEQNKGEYYVLPTPTRVGYKFAGWSGSGTDGISQDVYNYPLSSNVETVFDGNTYFNYGRTFLYQDVITVNTWAYIDFDELNSAKLISCAERGGWSLFISRAQSWFEIFDASTNDYVHAGMTGTTQYDKGWHMFTGVFDGTNVYLYIDKELKASTQCPNAPNQLISYYTTIPVWVGAEAGSYTDVPDSGSAPFKGKQKCLTIQHRAWTSAEVSQAYNMVGTAIYMFGSTNANLTAQWEKVNTNALYIDPNGGAYNNYTGIASFTGSADSLQAISTPTRAGYKFAGWSGVGQQNLTQDFYGLTPSFNQEVNFDGVSVAYNYGRDYMYQDAITINLWAYMADWQDFYGDNYRLFSCTENGGFSVYPRTKYEDRIQVGIDFYDYYASKYAGTLWTVVSYSVLNSGDNWHMFTFTFDGSKIRMYLDGTNVGVGNYTFSNAPNGKIGYNATNSLHIGTEALGSAYGHTDVYFAGKMKSVTVQNYCMSDALISQLYSDNTQHTYYIFDNQSRTLIANWEPISRDSVVHIDADVGQYGGASSGQYGNLLDVSSIDAGDLRFVGYDTSQTNYLTQNVYGLPCSTAEEIAFDGVSDYYNLGRKYMYEDYLSINMWFYTEDCNRTGSNAQNLLSCTQNGGFELDLPKNNTKGTLFFEALDKYTNAYKYISADNVITEAGWYMVSIVFDGTRLSLYVNTVLVGQSPIFENAPYGRIGYNSQNSLFIGAEATESSVLPDMGLAFKGKIKGLGIMNCTLTQQMINTLYTNNCEKAYFVCDNQNVVKLTAKYQAHISFDSNTVGVQFTGDIDGWYDLYSTITFSASVGVGYLFNYWLVDDMHFAGDTSNPLTVIVGAKNVVYSAIFIAPGTTGLCAIEVLLVDSDNKIISPDNTASAEAIGYGAMLGYSSEVNVDVVHIWGLACEGYKFAYWAVMSYGELVPLTYIENGNEVLYGDCCDLPVDMVRNKTIYACFIKNS